MTDGAHGLAQHPPAVKVAGRRLSLSTKHRPRATSESTPAGDKDSTDDNPPAADYPRPAPPGDEHEHPPPPHNEEEAPLKKDKKHGNHENEKKLQELAHRREEANRPTRDIPVGSKTFGAGGRIAQPAGRAFTGRIL